MVELKWSLQFRLNSGEFQFQFQCFQFQFRNWNWNWSQFRFQFRNWPQPWFALDLLERVGVLRFSAANLALTGFPLTDALGENMPSRYQNMFNLCLCNAAIIRYSLSKFGHMYPCGIEYKYFFYHIVVSVSVLPQKYVIVHAMGLVYSDSVHSGSEHKEASQARTGLPQPTAGTDWLKSTVTR